MEPQNIDLPKQFCVRGTKQELLPDLKIQYKIMTTKTDTETNGMDEAAQE